MAAETGFLGAIHSRLLLKNGASMAVRVRVNLRMHEKQEAHNIYANSVELTTWRRLNDRWRCHLNLERGVNFYFSALRE